jgi:1,2-diacylglycerol 3-beta-galactosyltransferase
MSSAIERSLRRRYRDSVEIFVEDVFAIEPRTAFERATDLYGPCIRVAPWFYGWLYHGINGPRRYRAFCSLQRMTRAKLTGLLDRARPDVIINTHPLANGPLVGALDELGRQIPILASVSELVSVHTSWVEPRVRHYNTGTDESYRAVLGWGAPPEFVRCFGLPTDERFAEVSREPAELRAEIGLAPDRVTALLIGGGEGAGGLESIVRAIQETTLDLQLIVVCGRNNPMRARLESARLRTPAHICGFVHTIPDLMRAADVIITKGGPQTIAESLVVGRPVILTQTIPGQEEGNGEFIRRHSVGFGPGPVDVVVKNLRRLIDNPTERTWMTDNARLLGRPRAASQVSELAWELAGAA